MQKISNAPIFEFETRAFLISEHVLEEIFLFSLSVNKASLFTGTYIVLYLCAVYVIHTTFHTTGLPYYMKVKCSLGDLFSNVLHEKVMYILSDVSTQEYSEAHVPMKL